VRLVIQHVIVQSRHLNAILPQRLHDRIDLLPSSTKSPVIAALPPPVG